MYIEFIKGHGKMKKTLIEMQKGFEELSTLLSVKNDSRKDEMKSFNEAKDVISVGVFIAIIVAINNLVWDIFHLIELNGNPQSPMNIIGAYTTNAIFTSFLAFVTGGIYVIIVIRQIHHNQEFEEFLSDISKMKETVKEVALIIQRDEEFVSLIKQKMNFKESLSFHVLLLKIKKAEKNLIKETLSILKSKLDVKDYGMIEKMIKRIRNEEDIPYIA
jgi:hypothetical protein